MPFNVDYSPVGALGNLAAAAGQGEGQQVANQQMIQLQQHLAQQGLGEQRMDLREQAFQLQQAMAERMAAARQRAPLADHVMQHLQYETDQRGVTQQASMAQLDALLRQGTITQAQYEQEKLAVIAGNKNLMASALSSKGGLPQSAQLQAELRPVRDKQKAIRKQMADLDKETGHGLTQTDRYAKDMDSYHTDLATEIANEQAILKKYGIGSVGSAGTSMTLDQAPATAGPQEGATGFSKSTGKKYVFKSGNWTPLQ